MASTSMPKSSLKIGVKVALNSLVSRLQRDYPEFHFVYGKRFSFRPPKTIVIGPDEGKNTPLLVFHELGHAISGEYSYALSIERLKIESLAWQEGKKAYQNYQDLALPAWDDSFVEDNLDTYRNWLHQKSKCPSCGLTRYQDANQKWCCPYCRQFKN